MPLVRRTCLAALVLALGLPAHAGEPVGSRSQDVGVACGFFRNQAFGKGLGHYATEMLWACETIARRRAGERPLGDRLEATDAALNRYRDAVIAEARRARAAPFTERDKQTLAEATGALVALSGIAEGF